PYSAHFFAGFLFPILVGGAPGPRGTHTVIKKFYQKKTNAARLVLNEIPQNYSLRAIQPDRHLFNPQFAIKRTRPLIKKQFGYLQGEGAKNFIFFHFSGFQDIDHQAQPIKNETPPRGVMGPRTLPGPPRQSP
ncbi:MAG: hypothetical protein AAF492_28045, partial [Verrucomicrobiota bacterium]